MDSPLEKLHKRLGWLRHDPDNAGLYRECANLALALRQFDVLRELSEISPRPMARSRRWMR